jgi:carbamoyltransferase
MLILGIQKHHNSSACVFHDSKLIYFNQEERLSRVKKDFGIPVKCLEQIKLITNKIDKVIITGYDYSNAENSLIMSYLKKIGFNITDLEWYAFYKDHHLCHAANAYYNSNFSDALIVVWDGRGSTYTLTDGSQAFETTTVYHSTKNSKLNLVYKRLYTPYGVSENAMVRPEIEVGVINQSYKFKNDTDKIEIRSDHDIGHVYEFVSNHMGFGPDECGKMMGLQSYGADNPLIPEILTVDFQTNMSLFDNDDPDIIDVDRYPQFSKEPKNQQHLIDLSYAVQKSFEKQAMNLISKMLSLTGEKNLILTGGASLNVVANAHVRETLADEIKIYAEPLCGDEGNCIGAVQIWRYSKNQIIEPAYTDVYIGPEYQLDLNFAKQEFNLANCDYSDVVELLIEANIVAIYQGRAEAGPRALGNRSLLFDPRLSNGKDIVNRIKKREEFRPFACSVIYEEADKWFNLGGLDESPYMMFALKAKKSVVEKIPAVVHIDGTCRIQTVKQQQNPELYRLIKGFYSRTEVPLLLNTSFNLAGEPLVETPQDAFNVLRNSELKYVYFPEMGKIVYKK